jgi:succinate dehydrogenase/fumarate reductase-like Fe-S protein
MVPPRLKALFLLAWALIRTVFRRVFTKNNDGIRRFVENYAADRLPPVHPEERERLAGFGRCIACGLCDRGEAQRIAASGGTYRGVMSLMLAASRSMPDFDAAALSFAHVSDEVLAEKEAICPTAVPMRQIARFVREKARELERSLPPTSVRSLPPVAKKL